MVFSLTHTHTHTHYLTHTHTHTLTHIHSITHTHKHTHFSNSLSFIHTHALTHSHTLYHSSFFQTFRLSRPFSLSLFLFYRKINILFALGGDHCQIGTMLKYWHKKGHDRLFRQMFETVTCKYVK